MVCDSDIKAGSLKFSERSLNSQHAGTLDSSSSNLGGPPRGFGGIRKLREENSGNKGKFRHRFEGTRETSREQGNLLIWKKGDKVKFQGIKETCNPPHFSWEALVWFYRRDNEGLLTS